jgi:outer membrane lipoprotein-sorting protein
MQGGELKGTVEIYNKAPNKTRVYMKIDLSAMGAGEMIIDNRCDGEKGYASNSMQGDREITGGQLEAMRNGVFPSALLNYKEAGAKVEVAGKEKVGDRDAIVLQFVPKTGPASKQYFDAENYQLLKLVAKIDVPELGGEIEQSTELQDYREVDGVKIPFKVKMTNPAQTFTMTFTKVEHNKPLDDSMFTKPAAK